MDSFDIRLCFVCTGRENKTNPVNLSVSPVPSSVFDLKLAIQDRFHIPRCLQTISVDSVGTALSNSQPIKDLYIRPDDCFTVTYLDKADIDTIRAFAENWLNPFLTKLANISEGKEDLVALQSIDYNVLHRHHGAVSYGKILTPWNGLSTVEANRQFLIQEKVIDNILKLYSLLLKISEETREDILGDLEVKCQSLLWNFAETRESRLYIVQRGGFELMLRSMESCWEERTKKKIGYGLKAEYDMYGLFDHSVGCLSNYSEIEHCQEPLASNSRVMSMLTSFSVSGPSLNIFTKVLIANCFFRLSHNVKTHKYLLETETLEKILKFFSKFNGNMGYKTSMVTCYALVLTFLRLLSFSLELIPSQLLNEVLEAVKTFTASVRPNKMAQSLEEYQCNWITMAPFVDIFFSPIQQTFGNVSSCKLSSLQETRDIRSICTQASVLSLTVEMSRSCHRRLAAKQGLLECMVCLPWVVEDKWKGEMCAVVKMLKEEGSNSNTHFPFPTLYTLAAVSLAMDGRLHIRDTFKFY